MGAKSRWRVQPGEILRQGPVVPVMVIHQLEHAVPLASALLAGGIRVLEITLRTPVSVAAIGAISREVPGAFVGAGTVTSGEELATVAAAGAVFAISPGLTPELLDAASRGPIPLIPGIATISELMTGMARGYDHFKFFPAEAAGGVKMLQAMGGPFPGFADDGANVAICARSEGGLETAVKDLEQRGVKVFARAVDVSDGPALRAFVAEAASALGGLDIFVSNASAGGGMGEQAWQATFEIDVMSAARGVEAALPFLAQSEAASVVFISSTVALEYLGVPQPYNAMKAALIAHAGDLSQALAKQGIRVNVVSPGPIYFEGGNWQMIQQSMPAIYQGALAQCAIGRMGTPEEVARAVVFLAVWSGMAWWFLALSRRQDAQPDLALAARLRRFSGPALIPLALTHHLASVRPTSSPIWRVSSASPRRDCARSAVPTCCPE